MALLDLAGKSVIRGIDIHQMIRGSSVKNGSVRGWCLQGEEKKKLIDIGFWFYRKLDSGLSNKILDRLINKYQSTSIANVEAGHIPA